MNKVPEKINLEELWLQNLPKVEDLPLMTGDEINIIQSMFGVYQLEIKMNQIIEYLEKNEKENR